MDTNNNYDIQQKRLTNVAEGTLNSDAITEHQLEVGLNEKHSNNGNSGALAREAEHHG